MRQARDEVRISRATLALLTFLTLLGAALRLAFLWQPMRLDETANYELVASQPLALMLRDYLPNNHTLHTILVHLVTGWFGGSPACIRSIAFVAGVALVPATYAAAKELFDPASALLAAGLVAASSPLIEFSTDARGYTLQALLVLFVFLAAPKILRGGGARWWALLAGSAMLGFAAIPTMAFFFAGALAWMLLSAALNDATLAVRPMAARVMACGAVVGVVAALEYLPFVLGSGLAAVTSNKWVKPLSFGEFCAGFWPSITEDAASWHRGLPLAASLVFAVGFVFSFVAPFARSGPLDVGERSGAARRDDARFRVNPVLITFACAIAMTTAQRVLPPERVWIPLVPLYLASVGDGWRWLVRGPAASIALVGRVPRSPLVVAAVTVLVAGGAGSLVLASGAPYQTPDQVTFRDAEPLTEMLGGVLADGDIVYVHWDAAYVLEYYFARHGIPRRYIYRPGRPFSIVTRAFAIDSHVEYPKFTFQEALNGSNLARSKDYDISVVAELPHTTLYRILNPELAEGTSGSFRKPRE